MASPESIAALRAMIADTETPYTFSDEQLAAIIDAQATMNAAAAQVWSLKAGQLASLVDVSESGSSRKLSDLRKSALEMSAYYAGLDAPATQTASGPVIHRIRRTVA